MEKEQLKILGSKEFDKNHEFYKIVDFLNKTLKNKGLIFGLALKGSNVALTIYEE